MLQSHLNILLSINTFIPHKKKERKKRQWNQRSYFQHPLDHRKIKRIPEKNIYFCPIDYAKAFECVDHNKLKNSERDGNTRPPFLPPEKSIYSSSLNT